MKLFYWSGKPNAGDYFSVWLLKKMGAKFECGTPANIAITGSILSLREVRYCKIWGCGFSNATDYRNSSNVYAVRGKMTMKKLGLSNIVTGDPGLLASYYYRPNVPKEYKFGIVSHYIDYDFFKSLNLPDYVNLISMGTNDVEHVLSEINKCKFILSSSLHGIVFSHSYNIPAIHIKHNELASKNSFKFLDYYSVFDIDYIEKIINNEEDLDWGEFDKMFMKRNKFVPSYKDVLSVQKNLLNTFPYKNQL